VRFQIPVHEMPNPLLTSSSPDGRWIAYAAVTDDGKSALWLQSLGSLTAQVLRGTEAAGAPFWSPDSRTLAFVSGGTLKTTATSGGQATTIANRVPGTRGTWNREGVILIGSQVGKDSPGGIQRTSARGGAPTPATTVDTASGETNHDFPFFLPDGRHFLYVAWSRQPQSRALYVGALDSAERKRLMPAESMVVYSDGQLLFLRSRSLMAQAFDARRLELTGEPPSSPRTSPRTHWSAAPHSMRRRTTPSSTERAQGSKPKAGSWRGSTGRARAWGNWAHRTAILGSSCRMTANAWPLS